ncbi:ABC transporter ATP-binding protein [Enterococcus sp. BWB1-3]|uniref:ABC transporter ATP-binding protein n=1 Tax=unclassified Enterococcus TaxID=2608891 RepID=UPI0019214CFA|nr:MULTISPECIES: ABC transporter ATP-binding protein [unclassified Enterococcus]MBL1230588.1 ABC transporter ATP-binding protein [Enterococcus sp. BWB1-3]MCB5950893.1 ABC transporter ATP-binding protein [Enterococcus sp. BWT-B8]MCB5955529.1 ABC transporter ATP-binding protein [Enterococcus sp. CWB-B31]
MTNVLTLNNVTYQYEDTKKNVLKGIDAAFEKGYVYTIVGKSGAGKSTLLSLISGLDTATSGEILCGDMSLKKIDRDKYRAENVGVIFQGYNLLTNATAVQNIVLSMHISKSHEKDKKTYAYRLLEKVGIDRETADRKILKMSGGEQQRVGIARALAHNPAILIADEPTGNLDKDTEKDILNTFTALAHEENRCVIIVTHSRKVTSIADVVYGIQDGRLNVIKQRRES